jgi:hypothetical protein
VHKRLKCYIENGVLDFNGDALKLTCKEAEESNDSTTVKIIYSIINMSATDDYMLRALIDRNYTNFVRLILLDESLNFPIDDFTFLRAVKKGMTDIVQLLLKAKHMDPSVFVNSAIHIACKKGYLQIVELLLEDERVNPGNSIVIAAKRGHLEIVKRLMKDHRLNRAFLSGALVSANKNNHRDVFDVLSSGSWLPRIYFDFVWDRTHGALNHKN